MEDAIKRLRDEDAAAGRSGIYDGWGHTGKNHSHGVHREYAVALSNEGLSFGETFSRAKHYVDSNDDIAAVTFSTNLDFGPRSKFGLGGELWFHKEVLLDKLKPCASQTLYIK